VDLLAYNSKAYYVVLEGGGNGDRVERFPVTGNDTVLDAIAQVGGLNQLSSRNVWVARPAPGHVGCDQILPVNWREITRGGSAKSNYQVLPGDRVFIAEDRMLAFGSTVDRLSAPFERMFGLLLLGTQTIQTMQRFPDGLNSF
jgi:protein involved in polysaccharide export with SLBB domain